MVRSCKHCEAPLPATSSPLRKFCSDACRFKNRPVAPSRRGACVKCGTGVQVGKNSAGSPKCLACRRLDADWYRERILGECSECDRPAVARSLCSTHYSYWRRRNVSGEWRPWVSPKVRAAVYVRDAGVCQICLERVDFSADRQRDDLAPSLDHIVPKSTQAVPDHSERNLRLAHRGCNARRGARIDVSV